MHNILYEIKTNKKDIKRAGKDANFDFVVNPIDAWGTGDGIWEGTELECAEYEGD